MSERVETFLKAVGIFEKLAKANLANAAWGQGENLKFLGLLDKEVSQMKEKLMSCDSNADAFKKEDKSMEKAAKDPKLRERLDMQIASFSQSSAAFEKLATAAILLLANKIEEQKKLRKNDVLKPLATEIGRGLKVLRTSLDAIAKGNDQWEANSQAVIDRLGKDLDQMAIIARNFRSSLKAEVAKALATAQRLKADPTAKEYNEEMQKGAARNVTQILSNIDKLTDKGHVLPGVIPANYKQLEAALTPFGNGKLLMVPLDTPKDKILAHISEFNKAIKAVKTAFGV